MNKSSSDMSVLLEVLKERDITPYVLSEETDIPRGSLYAYTSGRQPMPARYCIVVADYLEMEANDLFPDLDLLVSPTFDVKKNSEKSLPNSDGGLTDTSRDVQLTTELVIGDIQIGNKGLFQDGHSVLVDLLRDMDGSMVQTYQFSTVEQIMVHTAIKTERFNLDRVIFRLDKFLAEKYELSTSGAVYDFNGIMVIPLLSTGMPYTVAHGQKIGNLVFL